MLDNPVGEYQCFPFYPFIHYDGDSLWIYDQTEQQFALLYCMNALPGDTWTTEVTHSNGGFSDVITWSVLDTGTVIIDGISLRQINIEAINAELLWPHCSPNCTVIERIGNLHYMFDFPIGFCDVETYHGLRCYQDPEISWLHPDLTSCNLLMSAGDGEIPDRSTVWPNPASTEDLISVDLHGWKNARIVLTDAIGRTIISFETINDRVSLNVEHAGTYFLRVTGNGKTKTFPLVVL